LLVIGGGISGITAAVEAAEAGCEVIMVEKSPWLGGRVARLNRYFPKLCPPTCGLEINYQRIRKNDRIRIFTSATVEKVTGTKGHFTATIRKSGEFVNNLCTACGECMPVCPVERPDEFTSGIRTTKAIYMPDGITFPFIYAIDESACLKENCGKCALVCKYNAIDLTARPETITREVSSVILATGWEPFDAMQIPELGFGTTEKIVSNVMMETIVGSIDPTRVPPSPVIAFAQCTGSRDINYLPYCSGICCGTSLKQALLAREKWPECHVMIFYIDLRIQGRNEDVLARAQADPGITFIKGKVASASLQKDSGQVLVEAEDVMQNKKIKISVDLLVLVTGMVPGTCNLDQVNCDPNGFVDHRILPDGFFAVGNVLHPADVSTSVKEATAAALKGLQVYRSSGLQAFRPVDLKHTM
jgi:quinone-modifying oxidoreductase subunit QmoA